MVLSRLAPQLRGAPSPDVSSVARIIEYCMPCWMVIVPIAVDCAGIIIRDVTYHCTCPASVSSAERITTRIVAISMIRRSVPVLSSVAPSFPSFSIYAPLRS